MDTATADDAAAAVCRDRGYVMAGTVPGTDRPWPVLWRSDPATIRCAHPVWEQVLVAAGRFRKTVSEQVRCRTCHAPRCSDARDPDPCQRPRHHQDQCERLSRTGR